MILHAEKRTTVRNAPVRLIACPPILDAYDFSQFRTIVDLDGGHGLALASILARHPDLRGILFGRPSVVAEAPEFLEERGVAHRVQLAGGDIRKGVPSGMDAYLLRNVLRDWQDSDAEAILSRVAQAMPGCSKCLIVERLTMEGRQGGLGVRTPSEHEFLLACAGLVMTHVSWSLDGASIIEAMKA